MRAVGAALLACALVVLGLVVAPFSANAATGSTAAVSNVQIHPLTDSNSSTITDGARYAMSFEWDIAEPVVTPATLSVQIPRGLTLAADPGFDLLGTNGEDPIGWCTIDDPNGDGLDSTLNCTFNDDYVTGNPQNLHGGVTVSGTLQLNNTEDQTGITFTVGGSVSNAIDVKAKTPSTTCVENCPAQGWNSLKYGTVKRDADGTSYILWTVRFDATADGIAQGTTMTVTDPIPANSGLSGMRNPVYIFAYPLRAANGSVDTSKWLDVRNDVSIDLERGVITFPSLTPEAITAGMAQKYQTPTDSSSYINGSATPQAMYLVQFRTDIADQSAAPAIGTSFTNTATLKKVDTDTNEVERTGTATSQLPGAWGVGTNQGAFSIAKTVDGTAADKISATAQYQVNYRVLNPTEGQPETGTIMLSGDGESQTSPVFERGQQVQITEATLQDSDAVDWGEPTLTDAEGNPLALPYTVTFGDGGVPLGAPYELRLTNHATLLTTSFQVHKEVENPDGIPESALPTDYTVHYTYSYAEDTAFYSDSGEGDLTLPATGEAVTVTDIPVGATVTITEVAPVSDAGIVWDTPVIDNASFLADGTASANVVTVTNTARLATGQFSITKQLAGSGTDLVDADTAFTGTYSYPQTALFAAGSGTWSVKAGETWTSGALPAGAAVTIAEDQPDDVAATSWTVPAAQQVTIVAGGTTAATVVNIIDRELGAFSWTKVDSGTGDVLAGSQWTVSGPDGFVTTVVDNGTGDADSTPGVLRIADLPWGTYTLTEAQAPSGYLLSAKAHTVTIDADTAGETVALGKISNTKGAVAVGDYVWFDTDRDGIQDEGEPGIPGVELTLTGPDGKSVTDVNGKTVKPVKTDERGLYTFEDLPVLQDGQSYTVTVTDPRGYTPTVPGVGDRATDSSTGSASSEGLTRSGQRDDTLDFGYVGAVSVGDYVWIDNDRDGVQDRGETPLEGIELTLMGPDGAPVTDVFGNPVAPVKTDAEGKYTFDDLPVLAEGQSYTVTVTQAPNGYVSTTPGVGDRATDSSTTSASSEELTTPGERDATLDFGFVPVVSVGDYVWVDTNDDGLQDEGEPGIPGVELTLTGPDGKPVTDVHGNLVPLTTTDENGYYSFDDLPALPAGQHYTVTVTPPSGYVATLPGQGGDRARDSSTGSADSVDLTVPGSRDSTLDFGFVKRAAPAIDIEKRDTAGNDADTEAETVHISDSSQKVVFVITNTGNEPLQSVSVADEVIKGPSSVDGLLCTFPDSSTGVVYEGVLEPGASFECAATANGLAENEQHTDLGSVEGTGMESGIRVTDSDAYNAIRMPALATTGGQTPIGAAVAATVLLLIGGALVLYRRRHRAASAEEV